MSKNRFDILNVSTDNEIKKPRQTKNTESKQNIFKTKPKDKPSENPIKKPPDIKGPNNIFKKQDSKDSIINTNSPAIKSPNNIFKKHESSVFNINSMDFPELEKDKLELEKEKSELEKDHNYLEKINKKEIKKIVIDLVPPGWTLLRYRDIIYKRHLHINNNNNNNNNIALWRTRLIMENRLRQREELNDILGDISPYWNTNLYTDDDDENDDDNDSAYEEDDEYDTPEYYDD